MTTTPLVNQSPMPAGGAETAIQGLSEKVLRYFREFLESDFKRLQAPRRRIALTTQAGFRSGIDLRKYPAFFKDVWSLAAKPPQEMKLVLGRRKYRAQVSPLLQNLVEQYTGQLTDQGFADVRRAVVTFARSSRHEAASNPEGWAARVVTELAERTAALVVHPLLAMLEGPFKDAAYSAEDSIFEVEADLTEALCAGCAEHVIEPLNTMLLKGDELPLKQVLEEFLCADALRAQVIEFFEAFIAADAYQELRDVLNYVQTDDTLTTYLYLGSIKFGPNDYPLMYMPVTLQPQEDSSGYLMTVEPRLFINKQAIEYIVEQMRQQAERVSTAVIGQRILHLGEAETALERILAICRDLERTFDGMAKVDFSQPRPQVARSPQVRITNAAYLAAFDRSDESLVNDYEALLSSLQEDHQAAAAMFQGIVKSILFEEPASVTAEVRADWEAKPTPARLVTASPIPLNEEQIRIEAARRRPGCRFIAVEGPPGTGKSHTITALAFNAIMNHESVLIVSDKTEALDVVQDKLEQALGAVRHGDDFPNPILRIGKDGTYRSLISASSRVKIENHHKAQKANMPMVERELTEKSAELEQRIGQAVSALTSVQLAEVARLHALQARLEALAPGSAQQLAQIATQSEVDTLARHLAHWPDASRARVAAAYSAAPSLEHALRHLRLRSLIAEIRAKLGASGLAALRLFGPLQAGQGALLLTFIQRIKALRMPVLGYLLRGGRLAELDTEMARTLPVSSPLGLSRRVADLEEVATVLAMIGQAAPRHGLTDADTTEVYAALLAPPDTDPAADAAAPEPAQATSALALLAGLLRGTAFSGAGQPLVGGCVSAAIGAGDYLVLSRQLAATFAAIPQIDFVREKARLEQLNTMRLAHQLDSRFMSFVENHRATAQALGGVIKRRAQFPVDQFDTLREAFPCVIAGIRELGEFVPLKTQVFDLLVIDEGSQVSVAQAIPAILRAKQVVTFGDRRQFSNTKSAHASNLTNASYITDLKDYFRANMTTAVDKLDRLSRFDVKRSVLEFVELLASHTEMLRKHFRGYPELISFSSKHFYDGSLQAIKVRPVPIEDVLRFDVLEQDGSADGARETKRNTNAKEADHILGLLTEMLEQDDPPSVGIITPHTEQAALLSSMVVRHARGEEFESRLRLKIMTFDSCQGEERDVIIYSMVATRERDVLNYIFPVDLKRDQDENDTLKAQRLNVGFSRAKEAMVFVLSKPPEEFRGTIGQALMHFKNILQTRTLPDETDTDRNSPMERKLLQWLKATAFMQQEADRVELIAQFPVGDYLRQLDVTYNHPAYKADFLLRHFGEEGLTNILLEYDGFEFHFADRGRVTQANYEWYYRAEDVERQFVLESYGYRFLRVNRFNLGADPVATLDQRLREMIPLSRSSSSDDSTVGRIKQQAQAMDNKDAKACTRCGEVKDKSAFFDRSLGSGSGGYGRVCMACKSSAASGARTPRSTTGQRSFWRRH